MNEAPGALDRWEGRPVGEWARRWGVPAVEAYDQLPSTNERLRTLAGEGAAGFTVVIAESQTLGKGRGGKRWESPAGMGLWLSFLVPSHSLVSLALVPILVGLAATRALERLCPSLSPGIKWPNDIEVEGRKLGGILVEMAGGAAAVGIGINIASAPEDTETPATNLPADVAPEVLLDDIRVCFDVWYRRWREDGFAPLREAWLQHGIGLGEPIRARLARETVEGVFGGLDADGGLLLDRDGERRVIAAGDVFVGTS